MVKDRPGNDPRNNRRSESGGTGAGGELGPGDKQATRRKRSAPPSVVVEPRPQRFMVTPLPQQALPAGVAELSMDAVCDRLESLPDVTVIRRLPPSEKLQSTGTQPACPEIAIIEATEAQLPALWALRVHIEPDLPLSDTAPAAKFLPLRDPGLVTPLQEPVQIALRVCGPDGEPLADAAVFLIGASWPAQGITAADGTVTISLVTETERSIQSLYVRPRGGYTDRWIHYPDLSATRENLLTLAPLTAVYPELEEHQHHGWGQKAMRLEQLPPTFRGFGVKIAVIGSGVSIDHPDLKQQVRCGIDIVRPAEERWVRDPLGSGTHTAGIIAGADTGKGITGIAVDAELDICQVLPDGHFSDLIAALDHCIEHEIDIAHIAVASPYPSALISRKLADATTAGIACIAPAGDTGGPVAFPACLSTVFAVGALGAFGTYPPGTSHATHTGPQLTSEGLFAAPFSCYGPGIDAAAPGLAILSCTPGGGYAIADGTVTASAHIAGLAALVLADHEIFHSQLLPRGPGRVQHLFGIIAASCRPLAVPGTTEAARTGRGLPDALTALGLNPGMQPAQTVTPFTTN
ncbi:S8 family serine peptidase [Streptomyces sp. 1222.5]|uniref:S8 family serine peptidase n=1 Tax=Streptomyces sp. 1222.5 TaxID=1881026 RepID=UPI003D75789F